MRCKGSVRRTAMAEKRCGWVALAESGVALIASAPPCGPCNASTSATSRVPWSSSPRLSSSCHARHASHTRLARSSARQRRLEPRTPHDEHAGWYAGGMRWDLRQASLRRLPARRFGHRAATAPFRDACPRCGKPTQQNGIGCRNGPTANPFSRTSRAVNGDSNHIQRTGPLWQNRSSATWPPALQPGELGHEIFVVLQQHLHMRQLRATTHRADLASAPHAAVATKHRKGLARSTLGREGGREYRM